MRFPDLNPAWRGLRVAVMIFLTAAAALGARAQSAPQNPPARQPAAPAARTQPSPRSLKLVEHGYDFLAKNQAAQAETAFRQAVEAQPGLGEAHRGLGVALWKEGKLQQALEELQTAVNLDPGDAAAHYSLANLNWDLSRRQSSLTPAQRGGTSAPPSPYLMSALEEMKRVVALKPGDFGATLSLATLYLETGEPQKAAKAAGLAEGLSSTPRERSRAHVELGEAEFAHGDQTKAESEYRSALQADASNGAAHCGLGRLRLSQGRVPQAEDEFRECIRLSPDYAPAYPVLAQVLVRQGQSGEARKLLERAVTLDPDDWQSKYQLARLLEQAGKRKDATQMLEEVVKQAPDYLPAREQLGTTQLAHGDVAGAAAAAEAIMAANPAAPEGHRLMALVDWRKRDFESSLAECAQALAGAPDSGRLLALQSLDLWQLGRKKESRAVFLEAAKLVPRLGTAEVFCRLILCDVRDIGPVEEFLRKNRYLLLPPAEP